MSDLRHTLAQGRKRLGILLGAGAPMAIRVDNDNRLSAGGKPLIPDIRTITAEVVSGLCDTDRTVVEQLRGDIEAEADTVTIETILTKVRRLSQAIGTSHIHGFDSAAYRTLGNRICDLIGKRVEVQLPIERNPYSELASWIAGTQRQYPVEIFTTNYDLLIEEALESVRLPYFDGFVGGREPFFDPASVSSDAMPSRWSRLWKLHGSLGWTVANNRVVRSGQRTATELIYPDHLKYDEIGRLPYSALFERLREFLVTPDTLLICSGFSFLDAHISAVLQESMAANNHSAILAIQYGTLENEQAAVHLAQTRPNVSVYARNGAVINGVEGEWVPEATPEKEWEAIRGSFWTAGDSAGKPASFLLGDFGHLARFLALTQASQLAPDSGEPEARTEQKDGQEQAGDSDA